VSVVLSKLFKVLILLPLTFSASTINDEDKEVNSESTKNLILLEDK
jgi:uncharacterized membrane protein YadS